MNIYIVHLPHTFEYLIDLSLAFKKHGFSSVTLIANGFSHESILRLRDLVRDYDYLKILDLPTKRILSHGQALNFAFANNKSPYFCFADHDIFPKDSIVEDIIHGLSLADTVCLGDRPENITTEYKGFAASAIETQSGTPLATSFFSAYKADSLNQVMDQYKIGFEQYFRRSQIPESIVNDQDIQSLNEPFLIDTCKALSLAQHKVGQKISHLGSKKVCHLGGLCGAINRFENENRSLKKEFIIDSIPNRNELESFYKVNQRRHPKVMELKRAISDYALQLLIALKKDIEPPAFKTEDESINTIIKSLYDDTTKIFL